MIEIHIKANTVDEYRATLRALLNDAPLPELPAPPGPAPEAEQPAKPAKGKKTASKKAAAPKPQEEKGNGKQPGLKGGSKEAHSEAVKAGMNKTVDRAGIQAKFTALAQGSDEEYDRAIKMLEDAGVEHFSDLTDEQVAELPL